MRIEFFNGVNNLEELRLDNNRLTIIPDEISKLHALKYLTIWNNTDLETIPRSITNLIRLNSKEGVIEFGHRNTKYKWIHDDVANTYKTQLGKYPRPMPNQQWKTLMNTYNFAKQQVPGSTPLIHSALPPDTDIKIMSFLEPDQQKAIMEYRNRTSNKGGKRKTRKTHKRKS